MPTYQTNLIIVCKKKIDNKNKFVNSKEVYQQSQGMTSVRDDFGDEEY